MAIHIIGETGPTDPTRLDLMTKLRTPIPNTRRKPLAPVVMAAAVQLHATKGRQLRSASSEYNCMGMVFAARRTFVDIKDVSWIIDEDGYKSVPPEAVMAGDLLLYHDEEGPCHVGVVWQHQADVRQATWKTRVLSQWGASGEYFHDADDVAPLLGKPREFLTDRIDA